MAISKTQTQFIFDNAEQALDHIIETDRGPREGKATDILRTQAPNGVEVYVYAVDPKWDDRYVTFQATFKDATEADEFISIFDVRNQKDCTTSFPFKF